MERLKEANMSTLSLKNVNKIYPNGVQAVFDFNLEVQDKEFIVFVGPSGCGKSTTLRMIAGFEEITDGEIWIDNKCINTMAPKDRDIAMVFQNYALYPHMTVFENMAFALRLRKVYMPVLELDDKNPEYKEKEKEIIDTKQKELIEGIAALKKEKASKDRIKQFKFEKTAEAKKALAELDNQYSKQVFSYDREKVKTLDAELRKLNKEENKDEARINQIKAEIQEVMAKDDTPLYAFRHYKDKEIADRVMSAAEILGLIPYLKRKPAALSGGQRQRVALGRAIVRNPKVFLMDEPLSNLDAKLRVQTRSEIIKIHEKVGATTVYVTHDQTEAMTMASRIVIMKDGYIQQIGTPEEVYSHPANMFVGGFIGSPAMNFLKGKFDGQNFIINGEEKIKLVLDKTKQDLLKAYQGKNVFLGIRPEDIYEKGDNNNEKPSNTFDIECDMFELLGHEKIVYGNIDKQKIIIKESAKHQIKIGEAKQYCLDLDRVLFFDEETTKVIG